MTNQTKPAPSTVGALGFQAMLVDPNPRNDVDWAYLFGLPPFEMYLAEQVGNQNRLMWQDWLLKELASRDEKAVYKAYADWHREKGYWAGETPMGEIKE